MRFTGIVAKRSSSKPVDIPPADIAPGETKIQELNPGRRKTILEMTGWDTLEPGSLNLDVPNDVIFDLEKITPLWVEDALTLKYPSPFEHIPRFRKAYWYYVANASFSDLCLDVLVRRAQCPVPNTLELLAPVNIRAKFVVSDKDLLNVDVR